MQHTVAVQWHRNPGAQRELREEFRPEVAGLPHQGQRVRGKAVAGVEDAAGGRRRLAGSGIAQQHHIKARVSKGEGRAEPHDTGTDDGDVGTGVTHGVWLLVCMQKNIASPETLRRVAA